MIEYLPAAVSVLGGLFGQSEASGDREASRAMMERAYNDLIAMGAAPDLSAEIIYKELKKSGNYTPEAEQDLGDIHSTMLGLKEKPDILKAQMQALQGFKDLSRTGMTMTDRLAMEEAKEAAANAAKAERLTAVQNLQQTHQGGSGAEILANIIGGQPAMNNLSKQMMSVAANAQKARMDALSQMGGLSGQMRGQDLAYGQATRGAEDAMAKFNAENSAARQQRNVAGRNQASLYNLQTDQDIAKYNTDLMNKEKLRQVTARGEQWDRELQRRKAMGDVATASGKNLAEQGDKTATSWANIGAGAGGLLEKMLT